MLGFFKSVNLQKETSFFKKGTFKFNLISKNDKFILKESLATITTTTNYNFEETFENVFLK